MTFEEWLEGDDVGIDRGQEWIDDARIVWDAAIEAAAAVCEDFGRDIEVYPEFDLGGCFAEEVRALSSNEQVNRDDR